jgi:hypothetical protein
MIIMLLGRDYVCELLPPMGVLYGEPLWNDIDMGKHFILLPDLL